MQVGNTLSRVDHCQLGTVLMTGMQVFFNFFAQGLGQGSNFFVDAAEAVVWVYTQFFKQFAMFFKRVFVENFNSMAKHDGVRNFHHGGFNME